MLRRSRASRFDKGSSIKKRGGIAHDRPRQRHTLALAARQWLRAAVEQVLDLKGGCDTR